jgi:hypothetical protein
LLIWFRKAEANEALSVQAVEEGFSRYSGDTSPVQQMHCFLLAGFAR